MDPPVARRKAAEEEYRRFDPDYEGDQQGGDQTSGGNQQDGHTNPGPEQQVSDGSQQIESPVPSLDQYLQSNGDVEVLASKVRTGTRTVVPTFTKGIPGRVSYRKVSGAKALTVDPATGKIKVQKGTKKGAYKVVMAVILMGENGQSVTQDVTVKVKVVNKLTNTLTTNDVERTAKYSKTRKKAVTVARPIAVKSAKGKVTYRKAGGSKQLSVNQKNGKVTVKKGTKPGAYTIKIKVTAAGNGSYKKATKTVGCTVVVK